MEQKQKPERAMTDWISVKDRLPDHSGYYLVYALGGQDIAEYYKSVKPSGGFQNHRLTYTITHWQPLPEPPKEADHD